MPLHDNNKILIDHLEYLPLLDGRFENIIWVNKTSMGEQASCFSLVFSAYDVINKKKVALKFYDLGRLLDTYRIDCFKREHLVLQKIINHYRCLQVTSPFSTYNLDIELPGANVAIPCQYFAVDWVDDNLDNFFFNNGDVEAVQKLHLFNAIVLGVEALHQKEIFHRDIKQDNLRSYKDGTKNVVVAIDLGTAASFDSENLRSDYTIQPGANGYASPEARCGLSGNRFLSHYTDKYALGCLLFELFNKDYFYNAYIHRNTTYEPALFAMTSYLQGCKTEEEQFQQWKLALSKLGSNFSPVSINHYGSNVPHAIAHLLNEVLEKLTHHNFTVRPDFSWVRKRIWSAIRILESEVRSQNYEQLRKNKRAARQVKVQKAQDDLNRYLQGVISK